MIDFQLIQDAAGDVYYFRGYVLPDGCKLNPRPDVERVQGWWKPPRATQMPENESCVADGVWKIPCGVFSRIVGYLTDVNGWNKGKKHEWLERETYDVGKALDDCQ